MSRVATAGADADDFLVTRDSCAGNALRRYEVRMVRVRKLVRGRYRLALVSRNRAGRKHLEVRTITVR